MAQPNCLCCFLRGIGELLSRPLALPALPALVINPRVSVATRDVLAALNANRNCSVESVDDSATS
jgi:4-diphosphocytidyl-2-C-methyl-D-erythritol kinase